MLKGVLTGAWIATAIVGACWTSYYVGMNDGIATVVYNCNFYKKYQLDGTQQLLCSAIINPGELLPNEESKINKGKEAHVNKGSAGISPVQGASQSPVLKGRKVLQERSSKEK